MWVVLSILFVLGQPSGHKVLGGDDKAACERVRAAEIADAKKKGREIWIGVCQEVVKPLHKERDS